MRYKQARLFFFFLIVLSILPAGLGMIHPFVVILPLIAFILLLAAASFEIRMNFYLNSVNRGPDRMEVSITFDDGPDPENTPKILELLREHDIKAVFFCTGKAAAQYPGIIRQMLSEGHEIGNHTYTHSNFFDFYTVSKMADEISDTEKVIAKISGKKPDYFRPPYGVTNPALARALSFFNYIVVGWTFRTYDLKKDGIDGVIRRLEKNLRKGSILVFHDHNRNIHEILLASIGFIRNMGYDIVPLKKMIDGRQV